MTFFKNCILKQSIKADRVGCNEICPLGSTVVITKTSTSSKGPGVPYSKKLDHFLRGRLLWQWPEETKMEWRITWKYVAGVVKMGWAGGLEFLSEYVIPDPCSLSLSWIGFESEQKDTEGILVTCPMSPIQTVTRDPFPGRRSFSVWKVGYACKWRDSSP